MIKTDIMVRKIPLSKRSHITGFHPVRDGHGMIPFESALERDFITFVARHSELLRISSQPITVSWFDGNRNRKYTPDFKVEFACVPQELLNEGFAAETFVEVKYSDEIKNNAETIDARLDEVRAVSGCPAIVVDETLIRGRQPA